MTKQGITKYIKIADKTVFINGKSDFIGNDEQFGPFAKSVYRNYDIKYSKYFKMDNLCKLGFLASEILLKDIDLSNYKPEEVALILANSSSSLSNDNKYQNTISNQASPAVFVYTLANIVIGEICIRNNFKGESTFFIQKEFDTDFMVNYVNTILQTTKAKVCILGWVEVDIENNYEAFLCLIDRDNDSLLLTTENLNKILV